MTEKNAKPQLRFAGFDDTWEQRKLREVLISLQNNTLSRADLSSEEGIAKNIHYGDILVKFGEVIDLKTESLGIIKAKVVFCLPRINHRYEKFKLIGSLLFSFLHWSKGYLKMNRFSYRGMCIIQRSTIF